MTNKNQRKKEKRDREKKERIREEKERQEKQKETLELKQYINDFYETYEENEKLMNGFSYMFTKR
jgi:hypothetical protein